jgi:hypothetical protein
MRYFLSHDPKIYQDGNSEHTTILESPEKRRERMKIQIILFVILSIVGFSFIIYGIYPMVNASSASDINNDFDESTQNFKNYNTGDKIIISGKITEKIEATKLTNGTLARFPGTECKIKYKLDDKLDFYANEDAGDVGDSIIVECEVKLDSIIESNHYLKATMFFNPLLLIIVGIALVVIGSIAIIVSYKKLKITSTEKSIKAYNVAKLYKSLASEDDEDMMYHTLRSKNMGNKNVGKISSDHENKKTKSLASSNQSDRAPKPSESDPKPPLAQVVIGLEQKKSLMAKPVNQESINTNKSEPFIDDDLRKDK